MKYATLLAFSVSMMLVVPGCLGSEPSTDDGDEAVGETIDMPGLQTQAECVPQTKTTHSGYCGDCKTSGGWNGLYHEQWERECCGIYCTSWVKVSSVCGNCSG